MNGKQIAKMLYSRKGVYQVRDRFGRKLAEYESREEVVHFLHSRKHALLEIWHLNSSPGELKSIIPSRKFIEQ